MSTIAENSEKLQSEVFKPIIVPFHAHELLIVEHGNQPYTAMRPIVEGMGLAWQAQYEKLKQRFHSVVMEIMTTGKDGKQYKMLCLPLKKLFGWLMTISPNKVKPEIREAVIMFQNECDDALWDYWTKGHAVNPRAERINPEQAGILFDIVASRSGKDGSLRAYMWGHLKRHFKYASYHDLLASHFEEAKSILETMELKAKTDSLVSSPLSALELLAADTTNKVMDYYWALHREIDRLKGNKPQYPEFDQETIVQAVVTRMVDTKRMLLTISPSTGKPSISFIPSDSWILNSENIAKIVGDPSGPEKALLPDIISAAVKRLSR